MGRVQIWCEMLLFRLVLLAALLCVQACAPEPQIEPTASNVFSTSPTPAQARTPMHGPQTIAPDVVGTPTLQNACIPGTEGPPARHNVRARVDWSTHSVEVTQDVEYRNQTDLTLDAVVFNVETNRTPGTFELRRITDSSQELNAGVVLELTRLTVPLRVPLAPGCTAHLQLQYSLTIPRIANGYRQGHLGYWGYSERQINLGMWLPLVAPVDAEGKWNTPVAHDVGEHFALDLADFAVTLTLINAPQGAVLVGPGEVKQVGQSSWEFNLQGAREIAFSASADFAKLTNIASTGLIVELYYFEHQRAEALDAARWALNAATDAVVLFEELYGSLPLRRLVVVEGDFPDGMEFSGLVFVSEAWFRTWKGVPNDWLTLITVHEVAHQWWYHVVGNDQGRYPYLDEAPATYSELLFLEHYYPEYAAWWWNFRVNAEAPLGNVDQPVYSFRGARQYINAVYLRGAMFLHALRSGLGDAAFRAWLHDYLQQNKGRLGTPHDFWSALPAEAYALMDATRTAYMANPAVLPNQDNIP